MVMGITCGDLKLVPALVLVSATPRKNTGRALEGRKTKLEGVLQMTQDW